MCDEPHINRQLLFQWKADQLVDETVDVLLVLKTPWMPEDELNAQLRRLSVSLEAQVVNDNVPGRESASASESIFTGGLQDAANPFIIGDKITDDEGEGASQDVYAVWKLPVCLTRPRMRLHSPSIVFSASASLKPEIAAELNSSSSGYLQSGLPSGFNLLQSFSNDPGLHGIKPHLSALRVSRVAPVTRQQDLMTRIRALPQLSIKIFPVLHTRIRFSRPNTAPPSTAVVALLEVDFTPHFDCETLLDMIKLSTSNGIIENLNDEAAMQLPLSCVSHDHITFLYHITPHKNELQRSQDTTGNLDISIGATVQVIPGLCTPRLHMTWHTVLDFTTPVNPNFGPTADPGIQRSHRPSQLTITGTAVTPLKSPSVTRPDALPALEASTNQTEADVPDLGITMSFTAPSTPVHPGDIFSWTVYVVNRATEKSARPPRKLAFVAVPKRRRNEVRPVRPPSTASRRRGEKEIADAVWDDNVLHAMQKNSVVESTDLVCLSADTRVGPVAPGACHVVELQFLALRVGIVGLEAIRVVDLSSQEHVDIRELPTMVVEPAVA